MNRFFIAAAGILCLCFVMQSCLKDQEEIFDDDASIRLQEAMEEAAEALVAAEYGWYLEMYPESSQSYGGWVHTFVFDGELVKARSELYGSDYEVESYYKMTNDDGPVLSFDTYNEVIHYLSTPTSSLYQAYGGEFEFIVLDVTTDIITLKGKKTGNIMYLRQLEMDAEAYLEALTEIDDNIYFSTLEGTLAGYDVEITLDLDYRQFSFEDPTLVSDSDDEDEDDDSTVSVAYALTDWGIRFYEPVEIAGNEISGMYLTTTSSGAVTMYSEEVSSDLEPVLPELWRAYSSFEGEYTFIYESGSSSMDVTLTPAGDKSTYLMQGVNDYYDITLSYSKADGDLSMLGQMLYDATDDVGYYIGMVPYARAEGYIQYSTSSGMVAVWNGDEDNPVYTFEDNGVWGSYVCTSFYLYYWSANSIGSSYRVSSVSSTKYRVGSYTYIPYLVSLTKK